MDRTTSALIARTEGLTGEPLLTQWLAHILCQPTYQGTLIDFFAGTRIDRASLCDITIQDEGVDSAGDGRPDIDIRNEALALIVENKFDAGMTKNQPSGYLKVLKRREAKIRILTFLVPSYRGKELEEVLAPHSLTNRAITIRVCTWEALADTLNNAFPDSELIVEFSKDVRRRCKVQSPLTPSDFKNASDVLAGWLAQRELLKSIKEGILTHPGFKGLSVALEAKPEWDEDSCYMGMNVTGSDWVLWVGFWNLLQKKDPQETPLIGHVYDDSKDARKHFPQFWSKLKELRAGGLVRPLIPGHGWPIPVPLPLIQGKSVHEQAGNIVTYLSRILDGDIKAKKSTSN